MCIIIIDVQCFESDYSDVYLMNYSEVFTHSSPHLIFYILYEYSYQDASFPATYVNIPASYVSKKAKYNVCDVSNAFDIPKHTTGRNTAQFTDRSSSNLVPEKCFKVTGQYRQNICIYWINCWPVLGIRCY